jgi:hypothetical protein
MLEKGLDVLVLLGHTAISSMRWWADRTAAPRQLESRHIAGDFH